MTVVVRSVAPLPVDDLFAALRGTPMPGRDGALPYARADLELVAAVEPEALVPAQRYVLRPGLARTVALRGALLEHGVDLFALEGGVHVQLDGSSTSRPVIPPIVEASTDADGRPVLLIADGIHRVCAARAAGSAIAVVVVRGVPADLPYYAFPNGWDELVELDALPAGFVKKAYREPGDPHGLYRDYNAVLPGVQDLRPG